MSKKIGRCWRLPLFIGMVALACLSVSAQGHAPRENSLSIGKDQVIVLNASYMDVLHALGQPHYIGPALPSADSLVDILDPPPVAGGAQLSMSAPGSAPGMMANAANAVVGKKPQEKFVMWMYEGNGLTPRPELRWNVYVLFNLQGYVAAIMVATHSSAIRPPVTLKSGITFGSTLSKIVEPEYYDWPDPFVKVESNYFLWYPNQNVCLSVDAASRKVIAICVGRPYTIKFGTVNEKSETGAGSSNQPGGTLPPAPGSPSNGLPPPGGPGGRPSSVVPGGKVPGGAGYNPSMGTYLPF